MEPTRAESVNSASTDVATTKPKTKQPAITAFRQQNMKAWQPILTPKPVITTFFVLAVIFIPLGIGLLITSNTVIEITNQYDNQPQCATMGQSCNMTLIVSENMPGPVFVYYGLQNYYQNHRRYVSSRSDSQLQGIVETEYSSISSCDPFITNDTGNENDVNSFYLPCGLIAWSLFNDSFSIVSSNGSDVTLKKNGIAWPSDLNQKFHNPPADTPGIRIIPNFEDEDFIVWMRTAALPNFKKLYRIIENGLTPGNYTVVIQNNYPVSQFNGHKFFVVTTMSWIGGKNPFLGIAYIVVGSVCLFQAVIFLIKHIVSPRKLGDASALDAAYSRQQ